MTKSLSDADVIDPQYEMVEPAPSASLRHRIFGAIASFLYKHARKMEGRAYGGIFKNDSKPIFMSYIPVDQKAALESALKDEVLREAIIKGASAPRRTKEEADALVDKFTKPVHSDEQQYEWIAAPGNVDEGEEVDSGPEIPEA